METNRKNYQKKLKEIKEIFAKEAIQSKAWEGKIERETREHLERVKTQKAPDPDRPKSWRYIPSRTKEQIDEDNEKREQQRKTQQENGQLGLSNANSSEEEKEEEGKEGEWYTPREPQTVFYETDAERASRVAKNISDQETNPFIRQNNPSHGSHQYTSRGYLVATDEYKPWMRARTTNHCECLPRVRMPDPDLDWKSRPFYQKHIQQEQSHNEQRGRSRTQKPLFADTSTKPPPLEKAPPPPITLKNSICLTWMNRMGGSNKQNHNQEPLTLRKPPPLPASNNGTERRLSGDRNRKRRIRETSNKTPLYRSL